MDILFRQARIRDHEPLMDVAVGGGVIRSVSPCFEGEAERVVDAEGRVLIPGLVEGHLHLEKALISERRPNRSGTLAEAIAVTAALKPTFTREDILERSRRTLRMLVAAGTTCVRAHSEFDPVQGWTGVDAVLALRDEYRGIIDIQVVAFPQEGIVKAPGTEAMLYQAMEKGCDAVGGIPYNDPDAREHIDIVFKAARHFDKDLDLHQDFSDDANGMSIEYLARKTIENGWEGRVVCGHATSLGALPPDRLGAVIPLLRDAGITIMCLPNTDLHLGGRRDEYNVRRALTPVRALRDGGVTVCLASNNIRNAFTPFGNGDPLLVGNVAIPACHLGGADDLATVLPMLTTLPAKALGLKNYGLEQGKDADLVLLDTKKVSDAVIDMPDRLLVLKNGRIVAESRRERVFSF